MLRIYTKTTINFINSLKYVNYKLPLLEIFLFLYIRCLNKLVQSINKIPSVK